MKRTLILWTAVALAALTATAMPPASDPTPTSFDEGPVVRPAEEAAPRWSENPSFCKARRSLPECATRWKRA